MVGPELLAWVEALDGVTAKLARRGGTVALVGQALEPALSALSEAYPRSRVLGFGAGPADFAGTGYDLVAHIQPTAGEPGAAAVGAAARHVRRTLAPDGTWMIVADHRLERSLRTAALAGGFTRFRRAGGVAFVFEVRA